jgi:DNA polymerase-1
MSNDCTPQLVLIDGHALIYRAYHAFPGLTTPDGMLVNAVYGFARILLTVIRDFAPEYIAVAFDSKGPTLRSQEYDAYKAHRPEMPDDLKPQIEQVRQLVVGLNIPEFGVSGYEADDILGTIAGCVAEELPVVIVTGDKDLLQLVTDQVTVLIPGTKKNPNREFDPELVRSVLGVRPYQVTDLKAIMGDASDNIPGVPGIGKVGAAKLICTFGSLEQVYAAVDQVVAGATDTSGLLKGALLQKLIAGRASAALSKELATIERSVPISFEIEACRVAEYDKPAVLAQFEKLGFMSLIPLLPKDAFQLGVQDALF